MAKPELVEFGAYQEPTCCQGEMPPAPDGTPGPVIPGMRIYLQESYRGNPGAPLVMVRVGIPNGAHINRTLAKDEQKRSETESVTFKFDICVECSAIADDRTAHFALIGFDKDLNTSHDNRGIVVGEAQFVACCGNMPRKPKPRRPRRKN
jgi:hypothetical protein